MKIMGKMELKYTCVSKERTRTMKQKHDFINHEKTAVPQSSEDRAVGKSPKDRRNVQSRMTQRKKASSDEKEWEGANFAKLT